MKELLIVANTPSTNTQALADAVAKGAQHEDIDNVNVTLLRPQEADASHVLGCDGIIIGTTENFGAMSGLIKDFFERTYYPVLEERQGLPYALYIRAGLDGTGTEIGVEKILAGLRWKKAHHNLILHGDYDPNFLGQCNELGATMAAGLDAGIF